MKQIVNSDAKRSCDRLWRSALVFLIALTLIAIQMPLVARTLTHEDKKIGSGVTAAKIDVQREAQALTEFAHSLNDYELMLNRLPRNQTPTPDLQQYKLVREAGSRLKTSGIPDAARNFRELVRKLKDAGVFKDEQKLNRLVLEQIDKANIDSRAKPLVRDFLRENGGAIAVLEAAPDTIARLSQDIDNDLRALPSEEVMLRVAFLVPVSLTKNLGKCGAHIALCAGGLILAVLGSETVVAVAIGAGLAAAGANGAIENCV